MNTTAINHVLEITIESGHEVCVVAGAHPYLWIGDTEGFYIGSSNTDELRQIRDAITKALRDAPRAD